LTEWKYTDFHSKEYKRAVGEVLDGQREAVYPHLNDRRFAKLRRFVVEWSSAFYIEGAAPSRLDKYLFDVELEPGAKEVSVPLGRPSPAQAALEKIHVDRALALGHLRRPTAAQRSGWATRTHVVSKKDDPEGRWVHDFRSLNCVMKKRPIAIAHTHDQVRQLASCLW